MQELALYGSGLSPARILAHYIEGARPGGETSYPSVVLADSPVGYWRLGEAATSSVEPIAGQNAAWQGSLTSATGLLIGNANRAVAATANGYLSVASTVALSPTAAFTLECLIEPSSFAATQGLIEKWLVSGAGGYLMRLNTSGHVLYSPVQNNASTPQLGTSSAALSTGTTYHVCYTYDGTTGRLYIDGALDSSLPQGAGTAGSASLFLGSTGGAGGANELNGVLDEVAVYGVALSAGRVLAHYVEGLLRGGVTF